MNWFKVFVGMLTKERHEELKKGRLKNIYIQVTETNLIEQKLVDRKLRIPWGSDYPSTTLMVSHVIESHWLAQWYLTYAPPSVRVWYKAVFKVGPVAGL